VEHEGLVSVVDDPEISLNLLLILTQVDSLASFHEFHT
jgi:hypothetical protein